MAERVGAGPNVATEGNTGVVIRTNSAIIDAYRDAAVAGGLIEAERFEDGYEEWLRARSDTNIREFVQWTKDRNPNNKTRWDIVAVAQERVPAFRELAKGIVKRRQDYYVGLYNYLNSPEIPEGLRQTCWLMALQRGATSLLKEHQKEAFSAFFRKPILVSFGDGTSLDQVYKATATRVGSLAEKPVCTRIAIAGRLINRQLAETFGEECSEEARDLLRVLLFCRTQNIGIEFSRYVNLAEIWRELVIASDPTTVNKKTVLVNARNKLVQLMIERPEPFEYFWGDFVGEIPSRQEAIDRHRQVRSDQVKEVAQGRIARQKQRLHQWCESAIGEVNPEALVDKFLHGTLIGRGGFERDSMIAVLDVHYDPSCPEEAWVLVVQTTKATGETYYGSNCLRLVRLERLVQGEYSEIPNPTDLLKHRSKIHARSLTNKAVQFQQRDYRGSVYFSVNNHPGEPTVERVGVEGRKWIVKLTQPDGYSRFVWV